MVLELRGYRRIPQYWGNVSVEPSPREAAKRVEDCWHVAIKGTQYENQSSQSEPTNSYVAAKGR